MEEAEEEEEEEEEEGTVTSSQTPPMKNASPLVVHGASEGGSGRPQQEGEERGFHLTSTPLSNSRRDSLNADQSTLTSPYSCDSTPSKMVGPTRVINVAPHQHSGYHYASREEVLPPDQLKLDLELTEIWSPTSGTTPSGKTVKENEEGSAGAESGGKSPISTLHDATPDSVINRSSHETSLLNSLQFQKLKLAPGGESQHNTQYPLSLTAKSPLASEGHSSLSPLLSPHLMPSLRLSEPLDRKGPSKPCLQTSCKTLAILGEERLADVSQALPRGYLAYAGPHRMEGDLRQPSCLDARPADVKDAAGVTVKAVLDNRNVDIDHVAVPEFALAGYAVADNLVQRRADRAGKAAIVERGRYRLLLFGDVLVADPVQIAGGHSGTHMLADHVQHLGRKPARHAHALLLFGGFDGDLHAGGSVARKWYRALLPNRAFSPPPKAAGPPNAAVQRDRPMI